MRAGTCARADCTHHANERRRLNGKGVFRKQNGNVYEGEYKNDKCDGFGVYRFSNGLCDVLFKLMDCEAKRAWRLKNCHTCRKRLANC